VTPTYLAAALAATAVAALVPGAAPSLGALPSRPGTRRAMVALAGVGGLLVGSAVLDTHDVALAALGLLTASGIGRILRRRSAALAAQRRGERVLGVCEAIASDLAAGQPPSAALERAAREWDELAPAAAAGRMGADVPSALRELASRPGAGQLRRVAATWQVAHDTGAGLAVAMRAAGDAIRAERRTTRLVASELAAAHATARMLAVLPLFVLLLGMGIGGDPAGFLLRSTPGLVVLAAGLGLSFLGLSWLERIAERVLQP
jgi:tight adherence protein B